MSGRPHGRTIRKELERRVQQGDPVQTLQTRLVEIRAAIRVALCEMTVARGYLKPDLIVLDEFHRYREMLRAVPSSLAGKLLHQSRVLLLSATPFEYKRENWPGQPLVDLATFLYHGQGERVSTGLEKSLAQYRKLLLDEAPADERQRSAWLKQIVARKLKIESLLCPIMERTERWDDDQLVSARRISIKHDLQIGDLSTFDDFASRLRRAAQGRKHLNAVSHSTPLWMSVPYPVQTLPAGYVASRALAMADRGIPRSNAVRVRVPSKEAPPTAMKLALDHPKLRSLVHAPSQAKTLTLPWIAPSLPWWELGGPWADGQVASSKSLVFCHYRAAPPAIGGLISREVERIAGSTRIPWREIPRRSRFATGGSGPSRELLALFFPWRTLAKQFDPIAAGGLSKLEVLANAQRFVRTSLSKPHSVNSLCQQEVRVGREHPRQRELFHPLFDDLQALSTNTRRARR